MPSNKNLTLENDSYSDQLIAKLQKLNAITRKKVSISKIKKAIIFAKKYHAGQKRDSGEAFYSHPIIVAGMVTDYRFKTNAIITSILHDVVEDTDCTLEMIEKDFGKIIASNVEKLTRVKVDQKVSAKKIVEMLHYEKETDLLLIKLLDRLHNLETIHVKTFAKQQKIMAETLEVFVPIAICIGELKIAQKLQIVK